MNLKMTFGGTHEKRRLTPKEIVAQFKIVMKEAVKFYGKPASKINEHEFHFISQSRVGRGLIAKIGGYGKLKGYLYPADEARIDQATKALLERILA